MPEAVTRMEAQQARMVGSLELLDIGQRRVEEGVNAVRGAVGAARTEIAVVGKAVDEVRADVGRVERAVGKVRAQNEQHATNFAQFVVQNGKQFTGVNARLDGMAEEQRTAAVRQEAVLQAQREQQEQLRVQSYGLAGLAGGVLRLQEGQRSLLGVLATQARRQEQLQEEQNRRREQDRKALEETMHETGEEVVVQVTCLFSKQLDEQGQQLKDQGQRLARLEEDMLRREDGAAIERRLGERINEVPERVVNAVAQRFSAGSLQQTVGASSKSFLSTLAFNPHQNSTRRRSSSRSRSSSSCPGSGGNSLPSDITIHVVEPEE